MEVTEPKPELAAADLPRVIHQTWKHRHVRWPLSHCMASFRKWNPGWECKLWTDEEAEALIGAELPDFLSTYRAFAPGILRADIFRIAVLYLRGGVYADLDMECLRPLDELLATAGGDDWEVILARDHPCHELLHYKGRPMWLNAMMLAKPNSVYFARLLGELDQMAADCRVKGDAVGLTGPGLLTNMIERHENDLDGLGIRPIPWEWLHPLPNVFVRFPERPMYRRLIRTREWRDGKQVDMTSEEGGWRWTERPFAAHYWWHSYIGECRNNNMLERHASALLQSDGDIAETRLQSAEARNGSTLDSVASALAVFAEQGGGLILELGNPPAELHGDGFHQIAGTVLQGLNWKNERVPANGSSGAQLEAHRPQLLIVGEEGAPSIGTIVAAMQQTPQALLLLPGGLADLDLVKAVIEKGEWELLARDRLCLLRAIPSAMPAIPRVLHIPNCSPAERREWRLGGIHARLRTWSTLFSRAGWSTRAWAKDELIELIGGRAPEVVDSMWPAADTAACWQAARLFVAAWEGGVTADHELLSLRPCEALFRNAKVLISTRRQGQGIQATTSVVASEPGHPFWNGLETDALRWLGANPGKQLGSPFLEARAKDAARFMNKEDWPTLADPDWFGLNLSEIPTRVSPRRLQSSSTLQEMFPMAYALRIQ